MHALYSINANIFEETLNRIANTTNLEHNYLSAKADSGGALKQILSYKSNSYLAQLPLLDRRLYRK